MRAQSGQKHQVVIVGGGFGGLYATKAFAGADVELTLIDRRNFHLFQPLLYQVATGGLSPGDVASPLRAIFRNQKNADVLLGEVVDFDTARRRVILANGEVPYDTLIVAAGSTNSYFGHDKWCAFAPGLKSVEDATEIRRKVFFAFEAAEREPDAGKRREWLTFLIIGGGPTGVELAGALSEIARDTLKDDFRVIRPAEAQILLIDAGQRVLAPYPPELSAAAERSLVRLGVRPRTGLFVSDVDAEGVWVKGPDGPLRIQARTVIWAAGVAASPLGRMLASRTGASTDRMGRVQVEPDLTLAGHPEIFVIGDLAAFEQDGKPLPGVAPVAMQQGRFVAQELRRRLRGDPARVFHYVNKGSLATIGRAAAVADFGFARFSGWVAWLLWLFIHLLYLVGFQSRLVVLIQWAFQYLTFNRGARLITGENPDLPAMAPLPGERLKPYAADRSETSGSGRC